jgi:hypothetical protein
MDGDAAAGDAAALGDAAAEGEPAGAAAPVVVGLAGAAVGDAGALGEQASAKNAATMPVDQSDNRTVTTPSHSIVALYRVWQHPRACLWGDGGQYIAGLVGPQ